MGGGSGGGSTTASTVPEYARPYVETMLGATQQQLFNTTKGADGTTEITGFKPYTPYSTDPTHYFAGPSSLTTGAYNEAAGMQTPGQFGGATGLAGAAGQGALGTVNPAMGYGGMGSRYGRQGANIGMGALGYGGMGAGLGAEAAGAGERYAQQATSPESMGAYMSPYMQNVVDTQKSAAIRDYQKAMPGLAAQQIKAGAFGGTRGAVERAEAQRNLASQLQGIQATGQQQAFQNAQQAQQFGANLGLQGLQAGMQGAGLGLQGISGALAGTAQGMQGAQAGLQGVNAAQAGYGLANTAAQNLANIGTQQQQADLARMNFQNQLGQQQQQYQQNLINQQIQDYATQQQYPYMQLGMMSNMLRGLPMQSTSTQTYMPMGQQLMGYGLGALGASKAFG